MANARAKATKKGGTKQPAKASKPSAAKAKKTAKVAPRTAKKAGATKRTAKKATAKPTKKATAVFRTSDPHAAFAHFAKLAEAMPKDVPVAHFDPLVADANVKRAVRAIAPELERVLQVTLAVDRRAIEELPALSLALVMAAGKVGGAPSELGATIAATVAHLAQLRQDTLAFLEIASHRGLVPAEIPARIRPGHGNLDFAQDCIALAEAFVEYAPSLAQKHPFTGKEIRDLTQGGAWLLEHLTPHGAPKQAAVRDEAALLRDRLAAMLEASYGELEKAAVLAWGAAHFREHVPPLRSRRAVQAAAAEGEPGAPAAPNGGSGAPTT